MNFHKTIYKIISVNHKLFIFIFQMDVDSSEEECGGKAKADGGEAKPLFGEVLN